MAEEKTELQEQYIEMLRDIHLSVKEGNDFLVQESALVSQELLAVRYVNSITGCCVCSTITLLLAATACLFLYLTVKEAKTGKTEDVGFGFFLTAITCIVTFAIGSAAVLYGLDIAKVHYAPRVVVLEEVGNLLK